MNGPVRAESLVLAWGRTYTRGLHPLDRSARLDELRSDCFEQRHWGVEVGASPVAVATSMVTRTLAGMPADLSWRQAQRAALRDQSPNRRGRPMGRWMKDNWWVALAGLVGAFEVVLGIGLPFEDRTLGAAIGGTIIALLGATMLVGIRVRRTRRVTGDLMITAGTLPLYPFLWTVVFPLAGLAVAIPAMLDAADATAAGVAAQASEDEPDDRDPAIPWIFATILAAVAAGLIIDNGPDAVALVSPAVAVLIAHLLLRRRSWASRLGQVGMTAFVASIVTGLLTMAVLIGSGGEIDLGEGRLPGIVGSLTGVVGLGGLGAFALSMRSSRDRARPA